MPTDPCERIIANALRAAGVEFVAETQSPAGLDFYLPASNVHIEVKRMHSPRIAEQMSRAENVIAVQGMGAVQWLAEALRVSPTSGGGDE